MAQSPPLGFYLLPGATGADVVDRASKGSPWTCTCDARAIARIRANGSRVVYRPYLPDDGLCDDGTAWGRQIGAAIDGAGAPWPDVIVFRNECQRPDWAGNVQIGARYLQCRDALKALGFKGWLGLGSFAVGTPDWPMWQAIKNGLGGVKPDCVFLHEYWGDRCGDNAPWYELRHAEAVERGLLPANWPLFIGEINRDSPPGRAPGGWQGSVTADQQVANLTTYRAGCAPGVVACFVFGDGGNDPRWLSYHTFGTPLEAGIRATWGGPALVQAVSTPGPSPDQHSPTNTPGLPATGPAAPPPDVPRKVIAAVPYVPTNFRQDKYSSDCHAENGRRFGSRYFQPPDLDTFYQYEGLGPRPAGGAPATFEQLHQGIVTMCTKQGVLIGVAPADYQPGHSYLQTLDIDDDSTLGAALDDPDSANPWSNILVAHGADLGLRDDAGHLVPWDHFITAVRWAVRPTTVVLYDPASLWDHLPSETLALQEVEVAAHDVSWFSGEGRGYKIVSR